MRPRQSSFLEMPLIGTEVSPAHRPERTSALPKPVASRLSMLRRRQASLRISLARASFFLLALASPAVADILDFETLPSTYMYLGGSQNIDSYYAGVTFGPNVTGTAATAVPRFPEEPGNNHVPTVVDLCIGGCCVDNVAI